jgi:hypothetical protein
MAVMGAILGEIMENLDSPFHALKDLCWFGRHSIFNNLDILFWDNWRLI